MVPYSTPFPTTWQEHFLLDPRESSYVSESGPQGFCPFHSRKLCNFQHSIFVSKTLGSGIWFYPIKKLGTYLFCLQVSLWLSHGLCQKKENFWVRDKRIITHGTPSRMGISMLVLASPYSLSVWRQLGVSRWSLCTQWVCVAEEPKAKDPTCSRKSRKQISSPPSREWEDTPR